MPTKWRSYRDHRLCDANFTLCISRTASRSLLSFQWRCHGVDWGGIARGRSWNWYKSDEFLRGRVAPSPDPTLWARARHVCPLHIFWPGDAPVSFAGLAVVTNTHTDHVRHWRRQGGPMGHSPPPMAGQKKNFFVKIVGLSSFTWVKDDIGVTDILKISKITWNYLHYFSTKLVKILKLLYSLPCI